MQAQGMNRVSTLIKSISQSPVLARVVPFVVFVLITWLQDHTGPSGRYWCYVAKTIVVGWMLWQLRPALSEMRWEWSWAAVVVGIAVFIMWVGLDDWLARLGLKHPYHKWQLSGTPWMPQAILGLGLGWALNCARLLGSTIVVPPLEELFFRSFFYRYIQRKDFWTVPFSYFAWGPFVITSVFFGLEHHEWLAGLLCGFAYQGLVCWKNRLGDAITAHAITNLLLALWVMGRGAWQFW